MGITVKMQVSYLSAKISIYSMKRQENQLGYLLHNCFAHFPKLLSHLRGSQSVDDFSQSL